MFGGFGLYFLFVLPPFLLGLWAQWRVKSNFNKYSRVRTVREMTGAQVARAMLDAEGLYNVKVEESRGYLSDHYDPRSKTLRLSPEVYRTPSVAAAGIAAHEMGHALQDAKRYVPLVARSALVPAVQFGSSIGTWMLFGGLLLQGFLQFQFGFYIAVVGLALFAMTAVFALVTLPVEFDASSRAKKLLASHGILYNEELKGVDRVLDAAALTYIAAAIQALMTVAYYALILFGGRRD
ncbi:MAG: zinc metallopeptidase [Ardenticatenaceae bacterium]|nr:zinc metallopeptidase [Ardenticatenaceae bacterium]